MTEDFSTEIRYLKEKFNRAPESRLFAPLADAYRKNGQVDRAIDLCERGLVRYPDYASAHVILGKCFYDKGATERSRAEFERVIELDAENMVALKYMGDILLAEGRREDAVSYLRRLLAIDPANEEVAAMLEGLEEEFRSRSLDLEAGAEVRQVAQPAEMTTMTLAGIYAAQGYYTKSLNIYRGILERNPDHAEAKKMAEKVAGLLENSERERDETFDDEVLTISIDDVSDDVAAHTAGHGTGGARRGGPRGAGDAHGAPRPGAAARPVPGDREELERAARELEEADRSAERQKEETQAESSPDRIAGAARDGMDNFRKWLKKMHDDEAGAERGD